MALMILLLSLYPVLFRRFLSMPSAMLVSLAVTSAFAFSCTDQYKVSIEVYHQEVYVRLPLWLKSLVIAPGSLYLILLCVTDFFNVGLEIARNVSHNIRFFYMFFLHVALNIAARTHHYISLRGTLISLISATY